MTVRQARELTQPALHAQVCVIGGGIAGLVAATRIARSRKGRVIVLESGERQNDPAMWPIDRLENPRANYFGRSRCRGPGGTSVLWSGKLIPLSGSDMAARDWVGLSGWPIDPAQLTAYAPEVNRLMGVDPSSFEEDAASILDTGGLLPRDDPDFRIRWIKRPTTANHDLSHVLRSELAAEEGAEVILGATVAGFEFDGNRLMRVRTTGFSGASLDVTAEEFLICAGTFESTRLLFLADRAAGGVVSRQTDSLGANLNDHLGVDVATLQPLSWSRCARTLSDRWPQRTYRHPQFELTQEAQAQDCIGSAYFDIAVDAPAGSAIERMRTARTALRQRQLLVLARSAAAGATALPTLTRTGWWRYYRRQKYWQSDFRATIRLWIEQLPQPQNRLLLSERSDPLGLPMLAVTYEKTDFDERTFRSAAERLRSYWGRSFSRECPLVWDDDAFSGRYVDRSIELAHPAGTTRMGTNSAVSVVDPMLRVHAMPNVRVISASVFPTSGSANPVMTIMQLAMRAADDVIRRLAGRAFP